jgi:CDP-diglyceride synthetase
MMEAGAKKNLILRTLSGVLVVAVVVGAALGGLWTFAALVAIIGIFSLVEFGRLALLMKMNLFLSVPLRLVWIVLPLVLLMWVYMHAGASTVLWYIFIIWMNDIGAYVVGVPLGRHKLWPKISPKKSWEGFFGGVLFGMGTGIVAAFVMNENIYFWAGLALIAVITGVAGDLAESMFKRAAGVKDSGTLIPGHGGMFDRFDALLFSIPFVFVYILFMYLRY